MSLRLRKNEMCPLHRSRFCCGRGDIRTETKRQSRKWTMTEPGVRRYEDGREVCSPSALKRRKDNLIRKNPVCYACDRQFSEYGEIELAHIESKGSGSWKRRDNIENLVLLHAVTNWECGSQNLHDYMKSVRDDRKLFPCEGR